MLFMESIVVVKWYKQQPHMSTEENSSAGKFHCYRLTGNRPLNASGRRWNDCIRFKMVAASLFFSFLIHNYN